MRRFQLRSYQREYLQASIIHAIYLNGFKDWKRKLPKPSDFLFTHLDLSVPKSPTERLNDMTPEKHLDLAKAIRAMARKHA